MCDKSPVVMVPIDDLCHSNTVVLLSASCQVSLSPLTLIVFPQHQVAQRTVWIAPEHNTHLLLYWGSRYCSLEALLWYTSMSNVATSLILLFPVTIPLSLSANPELWLVWAIHVQHSWSNWKTKCLINYSIVIDMLLWLHKRVVCRPNRYLLFVSNLFSFIMLIVFVKSISSVQKRDTIHIISIV